MMKSSKASSLRSSSSLKIARACSAVLIPSSKSSAKTWTKGMKLMKSQRCQRCQRCQGLRGAHFMANELIHKERSTETTQSSVSLGPEPTPWCAVPFLGLSCHLLPGTLKILYFDWPFWDRILMNTYVGCTMFTRFWTSCFELLHASYSLYDSWAKE